MTRVDLARLSDVASGVPSGTSFPGSPADGDLFYRTDLDSLCRYRSTGTRWVTTALMGTDIAIQTVVVPLTGDNSFYGLLPTVDGDLWLEKIQFATQVTAPNNGSQYWTCSGLSFPSSTSLGSADTSADTAATPTRHSITVNALAGSTNNSWQLSMVKTSTPGSIYLFGATLFYRRVVT